MNDRTMPESICECPDLKGLSRKLKDVYALERRCEGFRREVDLDEIKPEDLGFMRDYRTAVASFRASIRGYYGMLRELITQGKLNLEKKGRKEVISCVSCGRNVDYIRARS